MGHGLFKYSSNENSNGKTIQDSFVLVKICISKVDGKCARISKGEGRIFQASYFDYFQSTKAGNISLMSWFTAQSKNSKLSRLALPSGLYWAMIVTVVPAPFSAAAACSCVASCKSVSLTWRWKLQSFKCGYIFFSSRIGYCQHV